MDATAVVDDVDVLGVPNGGGASLSLSVGDHDVMMVPTTCVPVSAIGSVTVAVTVTVDAETRAPLPAAVPSTPSTPSTSRAEANPGARAGAPTEPSPPLGSPAASPSGGGLSTLGWSEIEATPMNPRRATSQLPRSIGFAAAIVLLGATVAIAGGMVRSRHRADVARRSAAQREADQRTPPDSEDEDTDLRDRLRELVQASHRGADPGRVQAVRAELFAQSPRSDQEPES